ncbi:hypothetical protein [Butyrivibrio sp. TB]|uniref:hypothetical protein n=1 Tax=Butyrivibrio sp. TB TaxID=1520809 RepID=UPI0008B49018|nr:hypothetical protein [Butyrivibrio sp. TB]SEQ64762.1 hypothetical protein SAMN02910382_03669 [Butyrivibrio sp. TB]
MIFRYSIIIPLAYNRFDINSSNPDSESRFKLDDRITESFDISGSHDGYVFKDTLTISLFTTTGQVKGREMASVLNDSVDPYFTCEIDGLLVDDEKYARQYAEKIVNKLCKELSLLIIKHNSNRHLYQPRVEPNWSRAEWNRDEYLPYKEARFNSLKKDNGDAVELYIEDRVYMCDSVYRLATTSISKSEIDIKGWLGEADDDLQFLINEYYSALGIEKVKSKFFHLFAMIEFCEQKYADHNGAKTYLTATEVENIIKTIDKEISPEKKKNILSGVKKCLLQMNDTGRAQKLLNILKWMNIKKYSRFGKDTVIDKKMIEGIIKVRNKSFHGTVESEEACKTYRDAVEKLLYINEKIIEYVRQLKHMESDSG